MIASVVYNHEKPLVGEGTWSSKSADAVDEGTAMDAELLKRDAIVVNGQGENDSRTVGVGGEVEDVQHDAENDELIGSHKNRST